MPRLFVVATPIGNLEDLSPRGVKVLKETSLVVAEDTRLARVLLSHLGISKDLLSYNEHNRRSRIPTILDALNVGNVCLVTDAGTPAISDPGAELVAAAREAGHEVVAVPGPSAVTAALSVAGIAAPGFRFVGFLPRKAGELRQRFGELADQEETTVALESPRRLLKTLAVLGEVLPRRRLAVCRELTKLHEEVFVGTATEALAHFEEARGEIVLVIEGAGEQVEPPEAVVKVDPRAEVAEMKRLGLSRSQASALLASRYGLSHRESYALWLEKPVG